MSGISWYNFPSRTNWYRQVPQGQKQMMPVAFSPTEVFAEVEHPLKPPAKPSPGRRRQGQRSISVGVQVPRGWFSLGWLVPGQSRLLCSSSRVVSARPGRVCSSAVLEKMRFCSKWKFCGQALPLGLGQRPPGGCAVGWPWGCSWCRRLYDSAWVSSFLRNTCLLLVLFS